MCRKICDKRRSCLGSYTAKSEVSAESLRVELIREWLEYWALAEAAEGGGH